MHFFIGLHHPHQAGKVERAFISANALRRRKGPFPANAWIMDSGAFTEISTHGGYRHSVEEYAGEIRRWSANGRLLAAVAQDWMCEPFILDKTGLTIADHQRLTIERYHALLACDTAGVPVMPVLQGYAAADYVAHIRQYGDRLQAGAWVGVGSICKRNSNPGSIEVVLCAIKRERADLQLHGFGIKRTALEMQLVRDLLYSADSMAWSWAARWERRRQNDVNEAIRYARRIEEMPTQLPLFGGLHA